MDPFPSPFMARTNYHQLLGFLLLLHFQITEIPVVPSIRKLHPVAGLFSPSFNNSHPFSLTE